MAVAVAVAALESSPYPTRADRVPLRLLAEMGKSRDEGSVDSVADPCERVAVAFKIYSP